jgi:hypothetical protein
VNLMLGTIEDFAIVTSPIRRYLWVSLEQAMIFGQEDTFVRYYCWNHQDWGSFLLLEYTSACEKLFEEKVAELGIVPRLKAVNWPRLEESGWRKLNGITSPLDPLGVR